MMKKSRKEILEGAREAFFHTMLHGWASGSKNAVKTEVPGSPNNKESTYIAGFMHKKDFFRVVDRYCVSETGKSAGTTTIWFHRDPIWFMSYGGAYLKEDIPFLKNALVSVYSEKQFFGGRGPTSFAQAVLHLNGGILVYTNEVEKDSTFEKFRGKEAIIGPAKDGGSQEVRGRHDYWGMSLI